MQRSQLIGRGFTTPINYNVRLLTRDVPRSFQPLLGKQYIPPKWRLMGVKAREEFREFTTNNCHEIERLPDSSIRSQPEPGLSGYSFIRTRVNGAYKYDMLIL